MSDDVDTSHNGTQLPDSTDARRLDFLRKPPFDEEAERAALGAMLISQPAANEVLEVLAPEDFYLEAHRTMYAAMQRIYDNSDQVIDRIMVRQELLKSTDLERVGGMRYLHELMEDVPLVSNADAYAQIVRHAATKRRLLDAGSKIQDEATAPGSTPPEALTRATELVAEVTTHSSMADEGGLDGYVDLGEVLRGGVQPPDHLIPQVLLAGKAHQVFGPPGEGKSWLAAWLTLQTLRQQKTTLYIDAENGPETIAERMASLGATDAELSASVHYCASPTLTLEPNSVTAYTQTLDAVQPALVVIDSWADYFAMADLDENDAIAVTGWVRKIVESAKERGAAVVLLDHVPINSTSPRGRGSGAKLAKVDVSWQVQKIQDFDGHRVGQVDLIRRKVRHGELPKRLSFAAGGGESGMVFRLAAGVDETPDPTSGLTDSQCEALKTLGGLEATDASGATYTDWMHASGLHGTTFDRARETLLSRGLVEQTGQRYRSTLNHEFTPTAIQKSPLIVEDDGGNFSGSEEVEQSTYPHAPKGENPVDKPDSLAHVYPHATPTGVNGGSAPPATPTTPTTRKGGGSGGKEPGGGTDTGETENTGDGLTPKQRAERLRERYKREAVEGEPEGTA